MDADELLASLRKDAEAKVRQIWTEAEEAAARLEAEHASAVAALNERCSRLTAADIGKRRDDAMRRAEQESARLRRDAEASVSARLYPLALSALRSMTAGDGPEVFDALAAELPPLHWNRVRVNSRDAARARALFPGAEIIVDDGVSGGLEAAASDGSIRVLNTLEKRLRNAWEEFLPALMARCYEKVQGD